MDNIKMQINSLLKCNYPLNTKIGIVFNVILLLYLCL